MLVNKKFQFEAAHFLPNYNGKCENLHGHSYVFTVTAEAEKDKESGMALDFAKIKKTVKQKILIQLDHKNLNDIIKIPSAENIAIWIWRQLEKDFNLKQIKVWETENSWVTYDGK